MPCGDHPHIFLDGILALLSDESNQASPYKTNDPILFWIIIALVFYVPET
jgi:hypothetical protein